MRKYKLLRMILAAISLTLVLPVFSQSFPTGGYQDGTHGNIKYTLWTGTVDNDWSNPANWCPGVIPNGDEDVVIPSSAIVMPEVKSAGMSCKSLTIEPGADVTIKDGFVLTVNGQEVE